MATPITEGPSTEELLVAILALLVANREDRDPDPKNQQKTEVILDSAGLGAATIAKLMNKNAGAVRKTIQRSR